MQAKQLAFFVIAFSISLGVINASGIFGYDINSYEVNVDDDLTKGITEINNSVSSSSDLSTLVDGWEMLKSVYDLVWTILEVLVLPYYWLSEMGVNDGVAKGVQTMVSLAEAWGFIQFLANRSTKGME